MTSPWKWTLACAVVGLVVVVLYAPAVSAQVTAQPDPHRGHQEMMARMVEMDVNIEMLTADMNMFTGELKTSAMASLLTALVERNRVMRDSMMEMHEQMTSKMAGNSEAAAGKEKPGMKCSMMKPESGAPHP